VYLVDLILLVFQPKLFPDGLDKSFQLSLMKLNQAEINYENNFKVYQGWRDQLTRGLETGDKLRRPQHIKRPWVPLSDKAYKVDIK